MPKFLVTGINTISQELFADSEQAAMERFVSSNPGAVARYCIALLEDGNEQPRRIIGKCRGCGTVIFANETHQVVSSENEIFNCKKCIE